MTNKDRDRHSKRDKDMWDRVKGQEQEKSDTDKDRDKDVGTG